MQARMKNPVLVLPDALKALIALSEAATSTGIDPNLVPMVLLRASQINGCGVCVDMHWKALRKAGESDERIFGVAAWRDMTYFTDVERAALALTESATRLADRPDAVTDEVWNDVARLFSEEQLAALVISIAAINAWNRLNATTRQVVGSF